LEKKFYQYPGVQGNNFDKNEKVGASTMMTILPQSKSQCMNRSAPPF
jgi:hypothetical protein